MSAHYLNPEVLFEFLNRKIHQEDVALALRSTDSYARGLRHAYQDVLDYAEGMILKPVRAATGIKVIPLPVSQLKGVPFNVGEE